MICFKCNSLPYQHVVILNIHITESTIIATIHCPDVGYCLFGISLVTHIPYHVSCTFPIITESTIITTIHCPEVGYCLFRIPLVTHILYHVPCTFLIVIVSYWVVLLFARLFIPLAPCTQSGYSTLPTMYNWISTSVAIPCLFDSITCFVSYILSPLYLCFMT